MILVGLLAGASSSSLMWQYDRAVTMNDVRIYPAKGETSMRERRREKEEGGDDVLSIDCGSSDSYTEENSVNWVGDDSFVQNGKSQVVQIPNGVSQAMSTLRVFTTRKKNCYSINAEKGTQCLVRGSFYYGNYDKKSAPPSFDALLDGNFFETIQTTAEDVVYFEVIYVATTGSIQLCLAQSKPNQFPFISAIEVRAMDITMYPGFDSNYIMVTRMRVAYGAANTIRFPDDDYDRIWDPSGDVTGTLKVTSDAPGIDGIAIDQPPKLAMQTAITTSEKSQHLRLGTGLSRAKVPIYINMFFSEVILLDPLTDTRYFQIFVDDDTPSDPIIPIYGGVTDKTGSSNTSITLVATTASTLPPLINAMEVYYLQGPLTEGTNSKDVEGLAALQAEFSILQEWTGDPCLPSPYTWDWVNCTTDDTPRVTALYLNGYGLSGELPDFSSMDAPVTIDMHNNSLSGAIPSFLGTLPNLRELNLRDDELSGPVPSTISKNTKLKLEDSGNPNLCASGESCKTSASNDSPSSSGSSGTPKKSSNLPLILGIAIPAFLLFWGIVIVCVCVSTNKRRREAIGAIGTGQAGMANMPNGAQQRVQMMNGQMADKFGEVVMNQFEVNVEEQATPDYQQQVTPEHIQDQDDRRLHY
ncbi:PREDICTED: probable LRR receptor-like serine/threonine-protein kinase At1g05700-like [Fragaria vesca subsp. vesca]